MHGVTTVEKAAKVGQRFIGQWMGAVRKEGEVELGLT